MTTAQVTFYRRFQTRQALLEGVYVGEVEQVCRSAEELMEMSPWEGVSAWMFRLVSYLATKQAPAAELPDDTVRGGRAAAHPCTGGRRRSP